jgi:hypothetical protein
MDTNLLRPLTFLSPPTHNQFVFRCEMRLKTVVNRKRSYARLTEMLTADHNVAFEVCPCRRGQAYRQLLTEKTALRYGMYLL